LAIIEGIEMRKTKAVITMPALPGQAQQVSATIGSGPTRITVRHEHFHVRQMMALGVLFPALYLLTSLWAKVRGGDFYWDNWFEKSAYAAQEQPGQA